VDDGGGGAGAFGVAAPRLGSADLLRRLAGAVLSAIVKVSDAAALETVDSGGVVEAE
jgi:hypothetical protein